VVVTAGAPARLSFTVRDSAGASVHFLQFVHERPLHLLVVSRDLSEFWHLHPEPGFGDAYDVMHPFPVRGRYRLFADYTPPGSGTLVDRFDLEVQETRVRPRPWSRTSRRCAPVDGVRVTLGFDRTPRAGEDVTLTATLADSAGVPITDLQLYLGALAHFILISQDLASSSMPTRSRAARCSIPPPRRACTSTILRCSPRCWWDRAHPRSRQ
jgi:hypothetical protein